MNWSLLATCRSLTDLTLEAIGGLCPELTDAQVDDIRESLGHLHRFAVPMQLGNLARFLQPPVTARWRDIGPVRADARTGELLLRLPSLTSLHLLCHDASPVVFLSQLPLLTTLHLECFDDAACDALLAALQLCTGITELNLRCGFISSHWSALFAKLPLKRLTICGGKLESLRCFAEGSITQSLEHLTLAGLALPPSKVAQLYALRRLRTLALDRCFSSLLAVATLTRLSPPTALLPALTNLSQMPTFMGVGYQCGGVERQGPSFEWMQARLTR